MAIRKSIMLLVLLLTTCLAASAQSSRTFVSGLGNDSSPCSEAAPCRSFKEAISQTSPGGEVVVLDSASYDPIAITQSVSLIAPPGVYAGISVSTGIGVGINASSSDVVVLRGLTITSTGGTIGINLTSAKELHIEQCFVTGFLGEKGIGVSLDGATSSFIIDTSIKNNNIGVFAISTPGPASLSIDGVRLEGCAAGLTVREGVKASATNTVASGNSSAGFVVASHAASIVAELNLDRCMIAGNKFGISAVTSGGGLATARVSNSTVTDNLTGLSQSGAAVILSRLNNTVEGNSTNTSGTISSYTAR